MAPAGGITVVVLTFNRPALIRQRVRELSQLGSSVREILVVDNHSDIPAESVCEHEDGRVRYIRTERNLGAVARNRAFSEARGDIVICLDDDVFGLTDSALEELHSAFEEPRVAAVNFRVADGRTGRPINWCHHYDLETYWQQSFVTNEITEGAVAFSRAALQEVGGYPDSFFISHEGPDLAFRLLNRGYLVIYDPNVIVKHEPASEGRASWRRYYYDVRNVFWLAARNYPVGYATQRIFVQVGALFVYAIRDGYLRHWARGCIHGIAGFHAALRAREQPRRETMELIRHIERNRPPLVKLLKKRLFRRGVQI